MLAGTGFFIDDQGTVLTSSTIIGDNTRPASSSTACQLDAKIVGNDPRSGLAMLQVADDDSPFLPLGHSTDLKTGYAVVTIGYPLNLPVAPSQGSVSGFDVRYLEPAFSATTHIHANVPISPGQVGGPLLNIARAKSSASSCRARTTDARSTRCRSRRSRRSWPTSASTAAPSTAGSASTSSRRPTRPRRPHRARGRRPCPARPRARAASCPATRSCASIRAKFIAPPTSSTPRSSAMSAATMNVVVRRDEKLYNYSFAVIERPQIPAAATRVSVDPHGQPRPAGPGQSRRRQ